eukprot:12180959-Prorocentrum_lima.AAC.1
MFVSKVIEQKWQEWVASKESGTSTMKQPTVEASVARALESMERTMAMIEPSLKYLSMKGR